MVLGNTRDTEQTKLSNRNLYHESVGKVIFSR